VQPCTEEPSLFYRERLEEGGKEGCAHNPEGVAAVHRANVRDREIDSKRRTPLLGTP
jgi:hypothetical protein